MTLFAVHISDGVLAWPWLYYGFGAAACLLFLAMWRIRDEEIPRIGILTAAFFISALIHIRLPGVTVHLLLSGLIGVYSWTLLTNTSLTELDQSALNLANATLIEPWVIVGALLFAAAAIALERRLENTPEFPLGFLIGEVSVLMTAALNCALLLV